MRAAILSGAVAAVAVADSCRQVIWCENLDQETADQPLAGQDCDESLGCPGDRATMCRKGLDDFWGGAAVVRTGVARSATNALELIAPDDAFHTFTSQYDLGSGSYRLGARINFPADYAGSSYFLLLNTFDDDGQRSWSTQIHFDSAGDRVISDFDDGQNEVTFERGAWNLLSIVIDLDFDAQDIFFNGQHVVTKSWSEGVSGGGQARLELLDVFANDANRVYYDDLELCETCRADIDGSGTIDFDDVLAVLSAWGPCAGPCPEDLDRSGAVGFDDLLLVLAGWGPC